MTIRRTLVWVTVTLFLTVLVLILAVFTVLSVMDGSFDTELLLAWIFILLAVKILFQSRRSPTADATAD
ncbi:hypothetical protein [Natronolimnohabitans innermongolicus]|uniref:Uncharacterized protein n=1 Tax=Natronolimnohabitans innermongolicus JCM 12255 TaxID=1227499 RepID=L9XIA2_9EURY|nr:hypothetical protein [Natronolimnohabitans innermongolicus]ELY61131.1 hypothetical protein C493_03395 [Natronolimnohabitans innermongolicus JCM 12255]